MTDQDAYVFMVGMAPGEEWMKAEFMNGFCRKHYVRDCVECEAAQRGHQEGMVQGFKQGYLAALGFCYENAELPRAAKRSGSFLILEGAFEDHAREQGLIEEEVKP